jgi:hypothetical protein
MRGLVVWPSLIFDGGFDFHLEEPADPQMVRFWLLFWDRISVPWTGLIGIHWGEDIDYLIQKGAISEYKIPATPGPMKRAIKDGRYWLFEKMEAEAPGAWAIGTASDNDDYVACEDGRGLRVQLAGALPVPTQDVPLDEILFFKERTRDERAALMAHIDEIYLSAVEHPDRPLAEMVAVSRVAADARDFLRLCNEQRFRYRLADLTADFNLVGAGLAASASIGLGFGWPQIVGNTILAGASLTIGRTVGILKAKPSSSPYRYIIGYSKEVFRPE